MTFVVGPAWKRISHPWACKTEFLHPCYPWSQIIPLDFAPWSVFLVISYMLTHSQRRPVIFLRLEATNAHECTSDAPAKKYCFQFQQRLLVSAIKLRSLLRINNLISNAYVFWIWQTRYASLPRKHLRDDDSVVPILSWCSNQRSRKTFSSQFHFLLFDRYRSAEERVAYQKLSSGGLDKQDSHILTLS